MAAPVRLESIAFAHAPADPSISALPIRRDDATPVVVPEWRRDATIGPEDAPAAYAAARLVAPVLVVQVGRTAAAGDGELRAVDPLRLELETLGVDAASAAALLARSGNVLGDVAVAPVAFPPAPAAADVATLRMGLEPPGPLAERGVGVQDIAWRWQWRADPGDDWVDVGTTAHRVYLLLDRPTGPWVAGTGDPANTQLPWTAVLDHACRWAEGSTTSEAAATRVTQAVFDLGPDLFEYGCPILAATQYSSPVFDCTAFLDRLRGGLGNGRFLNCTDCATIVSTFANALGCDLWQSTMWTLGPTGVLDPFTVNEIVAIGSADWRTPCGWIGFNYHEVAWTGACGADDAVYDACLLIDGDPDPTADPHVPLLPADLRFGLPGEGGYRDLLADPAGRVKCAPQPSTRQRRFVT